MSQNEVSAEDRIYDLAAEVLDGEETDPSDIEATAADAIREWKLRKRGQKKP